MLAENRGVPKCSPYGKKHVHAREGLTCRKGVAAPGLLAHASVTETVKCCPMGPKLRYTMVLYQKRWLRMAHDVARWRGGTGVREASR